MKNKAIDLINKINFKFAIWASLLILAFLVIYHILILVGVIPYEYVWGGQIETRGQMLLGVIWSIGLNLFMIMIVANKGKIIKPFLPSKVTRGFTLLFLFMMLFNTIANLFAMSSIETAFFTPISFLLFVFFSRMALKNSETS
jgi:hypothetical protein